MDPLTQGILGATLPQALTTRSSYVARAGFLGFFAGMAADLDVLIRSTSDPLLFLEFHRHFTHSLIFIPVGGLLCGLLLYYLVGRARGLSLLDSWLFCTIGYATHALLDACTTYGTQLFWPFTDYRVAWNIISVVDPVYTVPLLIALIVSSRRGSMGIARFAMAWAVAYPTLGWVQRDRAEAAGWELAAQRGHTPVQLEAKPGFGNLLLWKIVYRTADSFYVDAVRVGASSRVYPGESIPILNTDRDLPWLQPGTQQALDLERFRWFSKDYIAPDPLHPDRVIDVRYSLIPNQVKPLWSIQLYPDADTFEHAQYVTSRDVGPETRKVFMEMLFPTSSKEINHDQIYP